MQASEELAIAVSELASNIIKYGVSGDILFEKVRAEHWGNGLRGDGARHPAPHDHCESVSASRRGCVGATRREATDGHASKTAA